MWDSVDATDAWISSQFPEPLQFCTVGNGPTPECINTRVGKNEGPEEDDAEEIDLETVAQCYCYIIAGGCMALGLRFAGTWNSNAKSLVFRYITKLKVYKYLQRPQYESVIQEFRDGEGVASTFCSIAGRQTIESCLCTCVTSASMILAGSGNLDLLKTIRKLRAKVDSETSYGHHMMYNMSLGLLFCSAGRQTCSNHENIKIACLYLSFYPKYPSHPTDNHYHLQVGLFFQ